MAFPGELNINYYKGDTHEFKVYPQKTDGSTFYLNDYSNATFTIAEARGSAGLASQINASAKIQSDHVVCAITPENGSVMDPTKTYVYDVQIYSQGADTYDKVFTLITGSISVTDDVTQDIGSPNKKIPTYRVIYHNTDATSGEPPTDSTKYLPTQTVTIKANTGTLARTGYYLAGWNTAADGLGVNHQIGSTTSSFNTDVKLYPKWVVNTVAYDNQSATTSHSGGVTSYTPPSAIATLPTVDPIRNNHAFRGWFTGPAGSGVQVTNGSYAPAFPYGPVILYAKWVPTYSVSYDDQSATTTYSGGSISYAQGESIPLIPTTEPIRTNHVFGGWFTGPAGSGVQVTNATYTPLSPYGAVTLYAKWTAV
jgi:uncharacterized repeat protein (TIGR02543 family)